MSHTPGPWERLLGEAVTGHPIYKPGTVVTRIVEKRKPDETEFRGIALVDSGHANARLIAAAPTLLEALEAALPIIASDYERGSQQFQPIAPDKALKMIRAAINAATGGQQ